MLKVDNISLYYGAAQALRGVSISAEPGKVTCVLGRNGVGKTSLLRAMVGQYPISGGAIVFDGADILVEASRLTTPEPLLRTAWVKPGAFVVPYGTISAVELDLLDVMDKVVVDDWREAQSGRFGALRRHVDSGRLSAASLHAELGQIVTGVRPGRERDDERILFWHRGLAILDIAVGLAILRRAEQLDAGTMLRYRS